MAEQLAGGDDDWVKQMLAEAILGGSTSSAADPVSSTDPVSTDVPPIDVSLTEEPLLIEAPIELSDPEPEVRYEVVLTGPESGAGAITRPPIRYQVVLDDPVTDITDAGEPAPAVTSRLFERPNFDATNDPGVEDMLADEHAPVADLQERDERSRMRGAVEWLVVLGSAVVVALVLRTFLFQAFFIPSESMESTLQIDDRVLVNKLSYQFGDVERGEVVVFRRPDDQPGEFRDLIKRVIGLPGESIEARDNILFIDGQVLIEPYLAPGEEMRDFGPVLIPEGEFFMMGDNRDNSGDSRVFGPVNGDRFTGRAFFLFWPLNRLGSL